MTLALDALELELRRLAGVRSVGFDEREDLLLVQLHVRGDATDRSLLVDATRVAARHSDRPVGLEVVRWRAPEPAPAPSVTGAPTNGTVAPAPVEQRARLLAVLSFPDTDEVEVHLILDGRRTIGRAPASRGLAGAAHATLEALRGLGVELAPVVRWVRPVEGHDGEHGEAPLVAVAIEVDAHSPDDPPARFVVHGLAAGTSGIEAAARATLDALNRRLLSFG